MAWKHFKIDEFRCKCGCGRNEISEKLIDKLDALRTAVGFALPVTSGYRCPDHNAKVSSTGRTGPHTTGRAVDVGVRGAQALEVLTLALAGGQFTGIGINQKGGARFVHLDDLPPADGQPRPTVWTY
jgi:zinc D-Ala-D-Ala carboxypeptidase